METYSDTKLSIIKIHRKKNYIQLLFLLCHHRFVGILLFSPECQGEALTPLATARTYSFLGAIWTLSLAYLREPVPVVGLRPAFL